MGFLLPDLSRKDMGDRIVVRIHLNKLARQAPRDLLPRILRQRLAHRGDGLDLHTPEEDGIAFIRARGTRMTQAVPEYSLGIRPGCCQRIRKMVKGRCAI